MPEILPWNVNKSIRGQPHRLTIATHASMPVVDRSTAMMNSSRLVGRIVDGVARRQNQKSQ